MAVRVKDATAEQLRRATCTGCGRVMQRRGWLSVVPAALGKPICGKCLSERGSEK